MVETTKITHTLNKNIHFEIELNMKEITIDLLRHGDVAGGKKLLGITDEPLSELGWEQMRAILKNKKLTWEKIVSSPLQRCEAFSGEVSKMYSLPLNSNSQFKEFNFGEWDGKLLSELYSSDASKELIQFMQSPCSISPPGGENYQDFKLRVTTAWDALLVSLHEEEVGHCLLVIHAGVIRTIISHVLGFPETNLFRLDVPYACLTRIKQYEHYPPVLNFHGGQL